MKAYIQLIQDLHREMEELIRMPLKILQVL